MIVDFYIFILTLMMNKIKYLSRCFVYYTPIDHYNAYNYAGLLKLRGDLDMEIGSDAFVAF